MSIGIAKALTFWTIATFGLTADFAAAVTILPEQIAEIKAGENQVKTGCDALIHFDTLKFEPCIKKLAKAAKEKPFSQLGIFYGGYVSAMSYAHGGLPGARQTAWRLLERASILQKQLDVDPYTLCETLSANCKIRVPASEEMLRKGPPKPARIPNNLDPHQH